jgi:hypothetical protein
VLNYLRSVPTFSKFSEAKLEKVCAALDLQDWSKGQTVFRKGEVRTITIVMALIHRMQFIESTRARA